MRLLAETQHNMESARGNHTRGAATRNVRRFLAFPFPRASPRAVADVVDYHFIRSDLIYDQIVADGKSSESGLTCRLPHVRSGSNTPRGVFNTSNKTSCRFPIIRSDVR